MHRSKVFTFSKIICIVPKIPYLLYILVATFGHFEGIFSLGYRMIRLTLFFVLFVFRASCCNSDDGQTTINIATCGPSKKPVVVEQGSIPFREELAISGGQPFNYYFALLLMNNFQESYELELIKDIIQACRKTPLSSEEVRLKCRRFKSSEMKLKCQKAVETFYFPSEPCFLEEETRRKWLKLKGFDIINEGNHGADLLHTLNRIRSGRMMNVEVMYYVKRFELYARIQWNEWKLFLKSAHIFILKEWYALNVGPNDDDSS